VISSRDLVDISEEASSDVVSAAPIKGRGGSPEKTRGTGSPAQKESAMTDKEFSNNEVLSSEDCGDFSETTFSEGGFLVIDAGGDLLELDGSVTYISNKLSEIYLERFHVPTLELQWDHDVRRT